MRPLAERLTVLLVEPQYAGNVGHVARSLMNFGCTRLALVNPVSMTEEGRDRAVHAQRVLDDATLYPSFEAARADFDVLVGFTARVAERDKTHLRTPVVLRDFAPQLRALDGRIALVFGRESDGLLNEEVERCDALCEIPTSALYRSMNLSHAVTVALYELFRETEEVHRLRSASQTEKDLLFRYYGAMLDALEFPAYRRDVTLMMFRRLVGRAGLSRWDYHRLMGVTSMTMKRLRKWPPQDLPPLPPEAEDERPGPDPDA